MSVTHLKRDRPIGFNDKNPRIRKWAKKKIRISNSRGENSKISIWGGKNFIRF